MRNYGSDDPDTQAIADDAPTLHEVRPRRDGPFTSTREVWAHAHINAALSTLDTELRLLIAAVKRGAINREEMLTVAAMELDHAASTIAHYEERGQVAP